MPRDVFLSAALFLLAGAFTPGPNNAMLLASGVAFGWRRTLPHLLGVTIGYLAMFSTVALGAGRFFLDAPQLYDGMRIAAALYMLWLAWRIATSTTEADDGDAQRSRPMTFVEAVLFQWINPKGVGVAIATCATFLDPARLKSELPVMLTLLLAVSIASGGTWMLFGHGLREILADRQHRTIFNRAMALALVASLWPLFTHGLPSP